MELYVDSANVKTIKEFKKWLPIDGVTVNPSIISTERKPLFKLLDELLVLSDKYLHVQVISALKEDIIKEAERLHSISDKIIVKIPVSEQGLAAIKEIDTARIKVTATAIFSLTQALSAAKAGASYLAPYVSRLDSIEQSGVKLVKEMKYTIDKHQYSAKIIAASIKTSNQVKELLKTGVRAMTLSPEIMLQSHRHHLTDRAVAIFREDWDSVYKKFELDSEVK